MPILNVFVTFNLKGDVKYLWMVLITAFIFAILSWTLLEKRMLQLKQNKRLIAFLNKY
jgi:peptidoglycan/LPS O-acetylase OafA/YrhL